MEVKERQRRRKKNWSKDRREKRNRTNEFERKTEKKWERFTLSVLKNRFAGVITFHFIGLYTSFIHSFFFVVDKIIGSIYITSTHIWFYWIKQRPRNSTIAHSVCLFVVFVSIWNNGITAVVCESQSHQFITIVINVINVINIGGTSNLTLSNRIHKEFYRF